MATKLSHPSLLKAIAESWRSLFRTRKTIIVDAEREKLEVIEEVLGDENTRFDDARRFVARLNAPLDERSRAAKERRILIWERLFSLWAVFWSTLFPIIFVAFFWYDMIIPTALTDATRQEILLQPGDYGAFAILTFAVTVSAFCWFSSACLYIQSALDGWFMSTLSWLVRTVVPPSPEDRQ